MSDIQKFLDNLIINSGGRLSEKQINDLKSSINGDYPYTQAGTLTCNKGSVIISNTNPNISFNGVIQSPGPIQAPINETPVSFLYLDKTCPISNAISFDLEIFSSTQYAIYFSVKFRPVCIFSWIIKTGDPTPTLPSSDIGSYSGEGAW